MKFVARETIEYIYIYRERDKEADERGIYSSDNEMK